MPQPRPELVGTTPLGVPIVHAVEITDACSKNVHAMIFYTLKGSAWNVTIVRGDPDTADCVSITQSLGGMIEPLGQYLRFTAAFEKMAKSLGVLPFVLFGLINSNVPTPETLERT